MTTLSLDKTVEEIKIKDSKIDISKRNEFDHLDQEQRFNRLLEILYDRDLCLNLRISYLNPKEADIEKALEYYLSLNYSNI